MLLSMPTPQLQHIALHMGARHAWKLYGSCKELKEQIDCDEFWASQALYAVGRGYVNDYEALKFPEMWLLFDTINISGNRPQFFEKYVEKCRSVGLRGNVWDEKRQTILPKHDGRDLKYMGRYISALRFLNNSIEQPPWYDEHDPEHRQQAALLYLEPPTSMKEIVRRETLIDITRAKQDCYFDLYVMRAHFRKWDDYFGLDLGRKRAHVKAFVKGLNDCIVTIDTMEPYRHMKSMNEMLIEHGFSSDMPFNPLPLYAPLKAISGSSTDTLLMFHEFFQTMRNRRNYLQFRYEQLGEYVMAAFQYE